MRPSLVAAAALASLLALTSLQTTFAQTNDAEALALVQTYLERHNEHNLDGVMALYAEDAVFTLSMGRGDVTGKAAIRELETFDVLASSFLAPFGLVLRQEGDAWSVDIAGVLESSDVFSAAGLPIVIAEPVRAGFVLRNGKILKVKQPEIRPACRMAIVKAFSALATYLTDTNDPRAALVLNTSGRLNLTPQTLTLVIQLLKESPIAKANATAQLACSTLAR